MQQDPFGASASADAIHALGGVMYGADLGLAWEHKRWNAALVARNIASQHVKSDQDISVRRISVASSLEGARVTDERLTMDDLNEEDQDRVRGFWTRPLQKATLSIAAAYRFKTLTPEFEIRLGDDPEGKAERTLALGATWKPVEWAGIHAGTAAGEETHALSAGVSIAAGPIALDVAASQRLGVKNGIGMAAQLSVRP